MNFKQDTQLVLTALSTGGSSCQNTQTLKKIRQFGVYLFLISVSSNFCVSLQMFCIFASFLVYFCQMFLLCSFGVIVSVFWG